LQIDADTLLSTCRC